MSVVYHCCVQALQFENLEFGLWDFGGIQVPPARGQDFRQSQTRVFHFHPPPRPTTPFLSRPPFLQSSLLFSNHFSRYFSHIHIRLTQ
jgi:hypothetical protein